MAQYDITLKSSALTVSSSGVGDSTIVKIDDTHYLDFWVDTADADIYAQVFEINPSTGAITAKGTKVSVVGSSYISQLDCCKIDSTHYAVVYRGDGSDGFSRVIEVNTSTWALTLKGTAFEFETSDVYSPFVELFDSTHLIVFFGISGYGYMRMLTINTSTWQLSATASSSSLDTGGTVTNSRAVRLSGNKFFVIWTRGYDVRCQVVEVNTSTWGISLLSTQTVLHIENTNYVGNISIGKVSDTKIVVLHSSYQADNETYLKTVEISSDKASSVNSQIITTSSMTDSSLSMVSDSIFVLFYRVYNGSVYTQAYQLNGDNTFTSVGTPSGTMAGLSNSSILLTENTLVNTWNDSTDTTKYTQLCEINLITSPTVTTQAVSSITNVSAIGNGNITATGGENPHLRGIAYMPANSGDISFIPLPNPSFEDSTLGWAGAGTLARSSEQAKYGTYSMKVTWVSGSEAYAEVHPTPATYSGKKVTFGAWVWSNIPNMACLNIYDNQGAGYESAQSNYHTGDGTWQFLTVTKTLRSGLTDLILRCRIATISTNSAYFDGAIAVYSDSVSPTLAIDSGNYSTGAFTKALTGLTPNTAYRAVAFAQNSTGVGNGSTVGFTTIGTNIQINIGDTWKTVESIQINIGDSWKEVTNAQINIGDTWKTIY